jgi:hypothetical protein
MLLDYEETRMLLQGTPLQGLTDTQLKDAFIGTYPISFSDKQFKRILDKAMSADKYQMARLKSQETKSLLSYYKQEAIKKNSQITIQRFETIEDCFNDLLSYVAIAETLARLQLHQDKTIIKYEIEIRDLKNKINNLLDS